MVTIPPCPASRRCHLPQVAPELAGDTHILQKPVHSEQTHLRGGKRESWTTELGGSPKE